MPNGKIRTLLGEGFFEEEGNWCWMSAIGHMQVPPRSLAGRDLF